MAIRRLRLRQQTCGHADVPELSQRWCSWPALLASSLWQARQWSHSSCASTPHPHTDLIITHTSSTLPPTWNVRSQEARLPQRNRVRVLCQLLSYHNKITGATVWCCLQIAWSKFSHSDTIPACNRQRQTCDNSIHHASIVHVVKMDENHFPKVAILHYQGEYLNLLLRSHKCNTLTHTGLTALFPGLPG